jgi:hypothetical protein
MKLKRLLAYFIGLISLILPVITYLTYIKWLGFPDGHFSELNLAEKNLFRVFALPSFALGLFSIYVGWSTSKQTHNSKLIISTTLFCLLILIVIATEIYLRLHLDNGLGG